jgi:hypothetical protein
MNHPMDHQMDHPMNAYPQFSQSPQYPQQGYPQQNAAQMSPNQGMNQSMHGGQASMPQPGQYPQQPQGAMGFYSSPMNAPMYAPQYAPQFAPQFAQQQNSSLLNERFFKGLLIGAAAAYLLTNENVQRTAIKGAVKAWSLLQGGVEELKERFHDAEAEIRSETAE